MMLINFIIAWNILVWQLDKDQYECNGTSKLTESKITYLKTHSFSQMLTCCLHSPISLVFSLPPAQQNTHMTWHQSQAHFLLWHSHRPDTNHKQTSPSDITINLTPITSTHFAFDTTLNHSIYPLSQGRTQKKSKCSLTFKCKTGENVLVMSLKIIHNSQRKHTQLDIFNVCTI